MPVLSDPKHELFAQNLAKGMSQEAAYEAAGYKRHSGNATRLSGNERVKARVAELTARAADETVVTIKSIAKQLDEDRALAHKVEQPGAAVSASVAKGKLYGLISDKHELSGPGGGPIEHRDKTPEDVKNAVIELFGGASAKPA